MERYEYRIATISMFRDDVGPYKYQVDIPGLKMGTTMPASNNALEDILNSLGGMGWNVELLHESRADVGPARQYEFLLKRPLEAKAYDETIKPPGVATTPSPKCLGREGSTIIFDSPEQDVTGPMTDGTTPVDADPRKHKSARKF